MKMKWVILGFLVLMLSGCADNVNFTQAVMMEQVGFLYGLWHGMIAIIALVWHIFDNDVAVYAIYNTGSWYDFGFLLGVGAFSGSFNSTFLIQLVKGDKNDF